MSKPTKAFAVGDATYRRCKHAGKFIAGTVLPAVISRVKPATADVVLAAQLIRIDYWLRSLEQLRRQTDYQAVTAGCRAMLECAIDIALVRANPDDYEKVLDWEDSLRLKHAQALATYCAKDEEVKEHFERPIRWAETERDRIKALRLKHGWIERRKRPDGTIDELPRHPDRWTNYKLDHDAREADKVQKQWADEGPIFRFERYYETRYRELCWDTHGSGNARRQVGADQLPAIGARAFFDCARMSITAASWVVRHVGLWDDDWHNKFDEAASEMDAQYYGTLETYGVEIPAEDKPSAAKPRGSAPPKETGDVVRVYVLDRLTGEVARQLVVHEHVNDGHDPDDREYRVRCLELSDDEPWTWVDADVEGDALRLFFPEDEYRGFPPFLDLEKPRKPHPGQTWRLRRPDGATAATFVLRSVELSKSSRSEWKHGDIVHAAYEGKSYVARFIRTTRHGAALVHWAGDGTFSEIPIEDIIGASKERWVLELEGEDVEVEY